MRSGEMGYMMIRKKLSWELSLAAQEERQKEFEGRLDGDCQQGKWYCEKTFSLKEKKAKL